MNGDTVKLCVALLAVTGAVVAWSNGRPVPHLPGVLVADEPAQDPPADPESWRYDEYEIRPLADYELRARVLSVERYRWGRSASLAPVDLALGWGVMSDSQTLDRFELTQGSRYFTLYPQEGSIGLREALRHAANVHVIPADATARHALLGLKTGQLVTLRGRLVEVRGKDGFSWRSSLRRDDTGAGACELLWADEIEAD